MLDGRPHQLEKTSNAFSARSQTKGRKCDVHATCQDATAEELEGLLLPGKLPWPKSVALAAVPDSTPKVVRAWDECEDAVADMVNVRWMSAGAAMALVRSDEEAVGWRLGGAVEGDVAVSSRTRHRRDNRTEQQRLKKAFDADAAAAFRAAAMRLWPQPSAVCHRLVTRLAASGVTVDRAAAVGRLSAGVPPEELAKAACKKGVCKSGLCVFIQRAAPLAQEAQMAQRLAGVKRDAEKGADGGAAAVGTAKRPRPLKPASEPPATVSASRRLPAAVATEAPAQPEREEDEVDEAMGGDGSGGAFAAALGVPHMPPSPAHPPGPCVAGWNAARGTIGIPHLPADAVEAAAGLAMLVCDRVGVLQALDTLVREVAPEARDATRAVITVLYEAGLVKCYSGGNAVPLPHATHLRFLDAGADA